MFIFGKSAAPDSNTLIEYIPVGATDRRNAGNYDLTGKTQRDKTLNTGLKNLILVMFGQSNACCVNPSAYTITNASKVDNFCIYNGGVYAAVDPVLGCSTSSLGPGNPFTRLADTFVTNSIFDRVVLVPAGIGATTIAMWAADSYNRIAVTGRRLAAAGYVPGTGVTVGVCLQIGETDCGLGTLQAAYSASQSTVISNIRAWHSGPIFIAQSTFQTGTTSTGIRAAQAAAVTGGANGIWSLGDMDAFTTGNRQADNVHLNDTGAANWAAAMYTAMHAYGAPF